MIIYEDVREIRNQGRFHGLGYEHLVNGGDLTEIGKIIG